MGRHNSMAQKKKEKQKTTQRYQTYKKQSTISQQQNQIRIISGNTATKQATQQRFRKHISGNRSKRTFQSLLRHWNLVFPQGDDSDTIFAFLYSEYDIRLLKNSFC